MHGASDFRFPVRREFRSRVHGSCRTSSPSGSSARRRSGFSGNSPNCPEGKRRFFRKRENGTMNGTRRMRSRSSGTGSSIGTASTDSRMKRYRSGTRKRGGEAVRKKGISPSTGVSCFSRLKWRTTWSCTSFAIFHVSITPSLSGEKSDARFLIIVIYGSG